MDFFETLRTALGAMRANKMRTTLTMIGIIIGVSAVITMIALGEGARQSVTARIQAMGTNLLFVNAGSQRTGHVHQMAGSSIQLTRKDIERVAEKCDDIVDAVPEFSRNLQVKYGNRNWNTRVTGTTPNYGEVRNVAAVSGRYFTPQEEAGNARVCLIGTTVQENLFDPQDDPIGRTLRVGRMNFQVIGVLETKGQAGGFMNPDDMILVPLKTAQTRLFGVDYINMASLKVADAALMDRAFVAVESVLRGEHRLRDDQDNDFSIRSQSDVISAFETTTRTFSLLLAGIAGVSLVVGGIGIMNIMLVSVTERTREIGVRKAVGARRRDVLFQFLTEAVVISLTGGLIGVLLGIVASRVLTNLMQWTTIVSPRAVALSFAFSAAVGIIFGLYPARRASLQDPIDALRYE